MTSRSTSAHALVVDGTVVTAAELWLPLLDNLDLAEVAIHTHPDHRRRGHATRMLAHLEDVVRAMGRTKLLAEAAYPYDAPVDGAGHPGPDFLTSRGFGFGLGDVKRILDLPVDDEFLARLAAEAAPYHESYPLRSFVGPVPDEFVEQYAELDAAIVTDAPMGGIDLEPALARPGRGPRERGPDAAAAPDEVHDPCARRGRDEQMGFRPVERLGEFQKRLPTALRRPDRFGGTPTSKELR